MSRSIPQKASVALSSEEVQLRDTDAGKLIFTDFRGSKCAALIQSDRLTRLQFPENADSKIGAIYIGKVKNVAQNIDACFVEIAEGEICFLPLKDARQPLVRNRRFDGRIAAGDEFPVQIVRDAQKTKPASATAHITLSNDFFVLELGSERVNYSTKLSEQQRLSISGQLCEAHIVKGRGSQQSKTEQSKPDKSIPPANQLIPETIFQSDPQLPFLQFPPTGMIVRTNTGTVQPEIYTLAFLQLAEEYTRLLRSACYLQCFSCLRSASGPCETLLDQFFAPGEYDEIITDDAECFQEITGYFAKTASLSAKPVRHYTDASLSLCSLFSLNSRIEDALSERVWLKSGGYLIIQPTEALTVIDVNSGKYETKKKSEEAALRLNLEAAQEIALQLKLRNLSGIIIIDFINMCEEGSRKALLQQLKAAVRNDRIPTTVVDMTPLGLVELTRKKVSRPLHEQYRIK